MAAIRVFYLAPCVAPVGVGPAESYHVAHELVVVRLLGDGLERLGHDVVYIVGDECQRKHRCHIHAAIPSVAVAHDVPYAVGVVGGSLGHARRHQSGIVGLDLEVYVVGMGIVLPVARSRRLHTLQDVVACALVGSPEGIARMGEGMGKRRGGRVEPQPFIDLHKGQVHVDVVIQSGERVEVVAHQGVVPGYGHRVGNHAAGIFELSGSAIGYADGLASPSAPDFVCQGRAAQRHGLGSCPHGHSRHQGDERYSHSVCHNWCY